MVARSQEYDPSIPFGEKYWPPTYFDDPSQYVDEIYEGIVEDKPENYEDSIEVGRDDKTSSTTCTVVETEPSVSEEPQPLKRKRPKAKKPQSSELLRMELELNQARLDVQTKQERIEYLQNRLCEIDVLKKKNLNLSKSIDDLSKNNDDLVERCRLLQEGIDNLVAEKAKVELALANVHDNEQTLFALQARLAETVEENANLKNQLRSAGSYEQEVERLQKSCVDDQARIAQLLSQLKEAELCESHFSQESQNLKAEITSLKCTVAANKRWVVQYKNQLETARTDYKFALDQCEDLSKQVELKERANKVFADRIQAQSATILELKAQIERYKRRESTDVGDQSSSQFRTSSLNQQNDSGQSKGKQVFDWIKGMLSRL